MLSRRLACLELPAMPGEAAAPAAAEPAVPDAPAAAVAGLQGSLSFLGMASAARHSLFNTNQPIIQI